jgi:putative endonuclease
VGEQAPEVADNDPCYAFRVKTSYVYIMASRSRTLYPGVTNDLERRVAEHKRHLTPGFTSRYRIERLVYFETWGRIRNAIHREKEIKRWRRSKKIALIESMNVTWADLSEGSYGKAVSSARNRLQNDVDRDFRS